MIKTNRNKKELIVFLAKFVLLFITWEILYQFWLEPRAILDTWLTYVVASASQFVLAICGVKIDLATDVNNCQIISLNGRNTVMIAHPCNGLILHVLFAIFLICFKGHWLVKIITLILGMFVIYTINVLRVVALIQIAHYHRDWLDFSHKWLFTAIVYSCVFGIWLLWVNKLSKINPFRS